MDVITAILLGLAAGLFSVAVVLLALSAIARRGHIFQGDEIWRLFTEGSGDPPKGKVPRVVQSPPAWLGVPVWSERMLAKDNLLAGAHRRLSGGQLALWAFMQGKRYLIIALLFITIGPPLMALTTDSLTAIRRGLLGGLLMATYGLFRIVDFRRTLAAQARARLAVLLKALPYTVDFLVLMLDAGSDFANALAAYLAHGPDGPMKEELHLALQEIRAGASRVEALQRLSERNPLDEIQRLVLVAAQSERMGTPLAETLREQAELLRMERTQRATEIAENMAKDSQIWVAGIGLAMLLLLMGPFLLSLGSGMHGISH